MAKVYYISGIGTKRKYVHVDAYKRRYPRIGDVTAITWQSQPEYDPWGPGSGWGCEEWKQYHMALKEHFGLQQANTIFKLKWDAQGTFDSAYNWCKYNSPWITYFLNNGLDLRSAVSAIIVPIVTLPGDVIQNTGDTVSSISKLLKPIAFVALIGAGAYAYKQLK